MRVCVRKATEQLPGNCGKAPHHFPRGACWLISVGGRVQKSRGKYANVIIPTVSNDSGAGERTVDSISPRTVSWESFITFFFRYRTRVVFVVAIFQQSRPRLPVWK